MSKSAKLSGIKVTKGESPSEAIINKANQNYTVDDSLGRSITFKALTYTDQLLLLKALGKDSYNEALKVSLTPVYAVVSIDGVRVAKDSFESLIALSTRLGQEGLEAVINGMIEAFPQLSDVTTTADEVKDSIKK